MSLQSIFRITPLLALASLAVSAVACGETTGDSGTTGGSSSGGSSGMAAPQCESTGVAVADPTTNAVVDGNATPDFSCYSTPVMLTAPATVVAKGCVDIFGLGRSVKQGMRLSVYGADQNPGPNEDMPRYGTVDIMVDAASSCDSRGTYRITGVPSNTPLIFKTFDTDTGANKTAVDTYQYNVVLRADRHDTDGDGEFEFPANMIFVQTYTTIPSLIARPVEGQSNLSDGMGRGAVAGEIRDCNERSVGGAVVNGSCMEAGAPASPRLTYFNGGLDPQPAQPPRTSTNTDGLYAIVNVKTSTTAANGTTVNGFVHEVEAKVKTAEGVLSAGKAQIRVFPDSITVYSPQGLLPTVP